MNRDFKARVFLIGLLAGLFLPPSSTLATSMSDVGPLAEVDELAVQVRLGNSLALPPASTSPLFLNERSRLEDFKKEFLIRVANILTVGGLRVVPASSTHLDVGIFGGKFPESGSAQNIYLIMLSVCREDQGPCTPGRSILGVSSDEELEASLTEATITVVKEFLDARAQYRASRDEGRAQVRPQKSVICGPDVGGRKAAEDRPMLRSAMPARWRDTRKSVATCSA